MQGIRLRVFLLFSCFIFPSSDCRVIRRRSIDSEKPVTDRQLLNAINVIELAKQQRVTDSGPAAERILDSLTPDDIANELMQASFAEQLQEDDRAFDAQQIFQGLAEDDIDSDIGLSDEDNFERVIESESPERFGQEKQRLVEPVEKGELENIFKQPPPPASEQLQDESIESGSLKLKTVSTKEKILPNEVEKLLQNQEEIQSITTKPELNIVKVNKIATMENVPESGNVVGVVKTETTNWSLDPNNQDKLLLRKSEEILPFALESNGKELSNNPAVSAELAEYITQDIKKPKRSGETTSEQTAKYTVAAINVLKAYIDEQEQENRHLAKALNLATMSQMDEAGEYIDDEIDEIKEAAQNERNKQTLRDAIVSQFEGDTEDDLEMNKFQSTDKRSSESFDAEPVRLMYNENKDEGASEQGLQDERNQVINNLAEEKLKQYLSSQFNTIDEENAEYPRISQNALDDEYSRYRLNPFLRDLYDTESDDYIGQPKELYKYKNDECPTAEAIVDNCFIARQQQLLMDEEAINLCNRHQLCYTCGSYYGLTAESCDRGYINEASNACSQQQDGVKCQSEALGLFKLMAHYHHYNDDIPTSSCAAPCVYNFIIESSGG